MTDHHCGFLVPALGGVWQQCVTTRFLLQQQPQPSSTAYLSSGSVGQDSTVHGEIILQKSPEMATGVAVRYVIRSSGLCDDEEFDE